MSDGTDSVIVEAAMPAPVERVWAAVVDAAARSLWWPELTIEPFAGGAVEERWVEAGSPQVATGRVEDVVERESLRFAWSEPGWEASTVVTIEFRSGLDETVVRVTESGLTHLADGGRIAREHRAGWASHLDRLGEHVGSH